MQIYVNGQLLLTMAEAKRRLWNMCGESQYDFEEVLTVFNRAITGDVEAIETIFIISGYTMEIVTP